MNTEKLKELTKKEWHLPHEDKATRIIKSFSTTERTIFIFFFSLLLITGISLLLQVNKNFLVQVPGHGGKLVEGIIGSPRFVNPLLASSDIDKDLSSLIYSGLLKIDSKGKLVPDLAEKYTVSQDGLTYTFVLKDNIYFHDGEKVTTDDIVFTIEKVQDPNLKSPKEANWAGVKVEKVDEKTVTFTLRQPYSPFIQSTTMGIIPKHIWQGASIEEFPFSQYNIKPIGSGPYKISSISYSGGGLPTEYTLNSFKKYSLGEPYITTLVVKSYQNEKDIIDAYKNGDIESFYGISPKEIANLKISKENSVNSLLPRIFGVFLNQNSASVFVNKEVRQALELTAPKQEIVDSILYGYGVPIESPVPSINEKGDKEQNINKEEVLESAKKLLAEKGWKPNKDGILEKKDKTNTTTLSFSISTGNATELKEAAYLLQKEWQALGAQVEVKIFEIGDLNQKVIKERKYDALLFGVIVGRNTDLYPFWHSSERVNPGLNIAMYTNLKADKILENLRKTTDIDEETKLLNDLNKEIQNDMPAIFIYSPYFVYEIPEKVHNVTFEKVSTPTDRWSDINLWYIETNSVWKIFRN